MHRFHNSINFMLLKTLCCDFLSRIESLMVKASHQFYERSSCQRFEIWYVFDEFLLFELSLFIDFSQAFVIVIVAEDTELSQVFASSSDSCCSDPINWNKRQFSKSFTLIQSSHLLENPIHRSKIYGFDTLLDLSFLSLKLLDPSLHLLPLPHHHLCNLFYFEYVCICHLVFQVFFILQQCFEIIFVELCTVTAIFSCGWIVHEVHVFAFLWGIEVLKLELALQTDGGSLMLKFHLFEFGAWWILAKLGVESGEAFPDTSTDDILIAFFVLFIVLCRSIWYFNLRCLFLEHIVEILSADLPWRIQYMHCPFHITILEFKHTTVPFLIDLRILLAFFSWAWWMSAVIVHQEIILRGNGSEVLNSSFQCKDSLG